jgi:membrane fusion protein, multidrug efflux system
MTLSSPSADPTPGWISFRPLYWIAPRFPFLLGIFFMVLSCSSEPRVEPKPPAAIPVTVASVTQKSVPLQVRAIGNVEAYSVVSVKSQVGGLLAEVYFREGQDVKRGDPLFTIDPRPFEASLRQAEANLNQNLAQVKQAEANLNQNLAQVKQAEANLTRDIAQEKNAEEEAQRYKDLVAKEYVSKEQFDQLLTAAEAARATVAADRAAVENARAAVQASRAALENAQSGVQASRAALENARIQLGYCTIHSPLDGRTGSLLVQRGNLVKASDTQALVVINQVQPIYVTFSVPEQDLPEIKKYMALGKLKVEAFISQEEKRPEQGWLTFVDNAVDLTTGTIRLKGTFENRGKRLWPGQFVNVALTLTVEPAAVVVPTPALQTGQQGTFVFVVKPDQTVESRPVVTGGTVGEERVVEQGLKPGEVVVTDGQLRLSPGARVEIKNAAGQSLRKP